MSSKSTFSSSTSKSYALALYEIAKENSELDKVEAEINVLKKNGIVCSFSTYKGNNNLKSKLFYLKRFMYE